MWEISTPAEIRLREPIEISRRLHTDSITYFLQHLLQGSNRRKRKPSRRDVSPRLIRSPQLPLPIRQPGNESDMVVNLFRRGETARLRAESKRYRARVIYQNRTLIPDSFPPANKHHTPVAHYSAGYTRGSYRIRQHRAPNGHMTPSATQRLPDPAPCLLP